jgi:hypothetical protein
MEPSHSSLGRQNYGRDDINYILKQVFDEHVK